jgi:RimJ/RimL family protein N-acetyltransferase
MPALRHDEFGLPIGEEVPDWKPVALPPGNTMDGNWCRLQPLTVDHAPALFDAFAADDGRMWTYMPWGPFATAAELGTVIEWIATQPDWMGFAIVTPAGGPLGMSCYLRIDQTQGAIEVGAIAYAPALMRTTAGTEAMFLMAERAFDTGYRRYEWKCDDLNAPSRSAADRLGFRYEGTFRRAVVYKGRNRDTAWYSITDREWPAVREAYRSWLDPANFDDTGTQRTSLSTLVAATR